MRDKRLAPTTRDALPLPGRVQEVIAAEWLG
jgi:hypothetical protein